MFPIKKSQHKNFSSAMVADSKRLKDTWHQSCAYAKPRWGTLVLFWTEWPFSPNGIGDLKVENCCHKMILHSFRKAYLILGFEMFISIVGLVRWFSWYKCLYPSLMPWSQSLEAHQWWKNSLKLSTNIHMHTAQKHVHNIWS